MKESIEELTKKAKEGEQSAKEEIYLRYKSLVRIYANNYFLVGGEKEDLLQEGMIGLFDAVSDYCPHKGSFSAFAGLCIKRRITKAIDRANSGKSRVLLQAVELKDNLPDASPDPLDVAIGNDLLGEVKAFIANNLTQTERTVVEYFCCGYTHEEICAVTNRSYKSVDSALQRARKKLTELRQTL